MFRLAVALVCAGIGSAQNVQSPQALLREAITYQQQGKLAEAVRDYRLVLASYPNIPEVRSNLGAALAGQGLYSEAIGEYRRALETKSDPQVRLNLALAYYKTAQLQPAIDELRKVIEKQSGNTQAVTVLADCYLRLGRHKDVIALLTPYQAADPANKAFNYMLGTALVRDGQSDKGQVVIDRILRDGDSAEARMLMGATKFMVNDFAGARTDFEKAVALNPDLPEVYSWYGLALLSTGDQASAKKAFERELQSDPNNFEANLRMGILLRQDEANDEALKYFQHALEIRPGDFGVRYQIAALELAANRLDDARRELEKLVAEAPNFTEAHVSLATVYYREKKKPEGDKERAIVARLNAERQANEPAQKAQP